MNRAIKNKLRGNQRAPLLDIPQTRQPYLLAKYSGRANYGAGQYEVEVVKPLQPDGMNANWLGNQPANNS
jgi:hypothetical protein